MKILAIASVGGHWVQLLRLRPAFEGHEVVYVSNDPGFGVMVPGCRFHAVQDANRDRKMDLIRSFLDVLKIVRSERPDAIITTGAAPGLMGIVCGRLFGVKTVWIDSIANAECLSGSGKIALKFATRVYTQWPELANDKVTYAGNVIR